MSDYCGSCEDLDRDLTRANDCYEHLSNDYRQLSFELRDVREELSVALAERDALKLEVERLKRGPTFNYEAGRAAGFAEAIEAAAKAVLEMPLYDDRRNGFDGLVDKDDVTSVIRALRPGGAK